MNKCIRVVLFISSIFALTVASAEQVTKEQIKGLDEQVQDIKKDMLAISAELNLLEEKLLFPSNTQLSIFVSLDQDKRLEPSSVQIKLNDQDIVHHIYSFKEVDALLAGGVQRIYTGNVRSGEHSLEVDVLSINGESKKSQVSTHNINKGIGPQFVEIHIAASGVEIKNW